MSLQAALALAANGRGADAAAMLEACGDDPQARLALGLWRLEGRVVPRDLVRARQDIRTAADCGNVQAKRLLAHLLAAGAGGIRDWQGALALLGEIAGTDRNAAGQMALIEAMELTPGGEPLSLPAPRRLAEAPDIRLFPRLFTASECAWLAAAAAERLKPALIFHEGAQRFVRDPIRLSDAAGFPLVLEGPALSALNRRLAAASATDARQGEPLQVLRYSPGQEYRSHLDAVPGLANQRAWTFLVYLNEAFAGGETRFSEIGLDVRGQCGDGLLFSNILADGRPDPQSRHAGIPVRAGIKLIASRWIRSDIPTAEGGFGQHEVDRTRS